MTRCLCRKYAARPPKSTIAKVLAATATAWQSVATMNSQNDAVSPYGSSSVVLSVQLLIKVFRQTYATVCPKNGIDKTASNPNPPKFKYVL